MQTLTWQKKWFSQDYQIYDGAKQIGYLNNPSFSQTSKGTIHGKSLIFQTSGFLKQDTRIIDGLTFQEIGYISYNSWMNKAQIVINGKAYNWQYSNAWNNKWTISGTDGKMYYCQKHNQGGTMNVSEPEDFLTLTSLYITNYYQQMTIAVMVAVFIPIYVSVLT